jgi:predicted transposase/invertase (TIGR01784 family)
LNALLPLEEGREIVSIEYLPSELLPEIEGRKLSIVDVRCKDNFERKFIVEMQVRWSELFKNRMVFNACKSYVKQLGVSKQYDLLQTVYTLAIMNSNFDNKTSEFYHHFKMVNVNNLDESMPGQEYVLVELPKFKPEKIAEKKMAVLWLRFLTEVSENLVELPDELQNDEHNNKAAEVCKEAALSQEEKDRYDAFQDVVMTYNGMLEESKKEGRVEGRAEGKAEGRAEGKAELVVNAYRKGKSVEDIAEFTDLSLDEVIGILGKKVE